MTPKKHLVLKCSLVLVGSTLGGITFMLMMYFFVRDPQHIYASSVAVMSSANQGTAGIAPPVLTADQFMSHLSGFYESVIQILVTLIGLLAGVSYFYVRAMSEERAEDMARKHAEQAVRSRIESKAFDHDLRAQVEKETRRFDDAAASLDSRMTELDKLKADVALMEAGLRAVTSRIAELDTSESSDARKVEE